MRLYLINPSNTLISMTKSNRWRKYRVWKPLGLLTIAGLTPSDWDIKIIDENLGLPDYAALPKPDLVGITAFTAQAPRAYQIAADFRAQGIPVVMGGIHASMCPDEALQYVDAVVTGEAEAVWATVLADLQRGALQRRYEGGLVDLIDSPPARHDLLATGYAFGVVQTTRGCPLNCHFCSVSTFNGQRYRHRTIAAVVQEMTQIRERLVLIVDDNLIGTRPEHIARAKDLMRAIIAAKLNKRWICQATINFADDEELLTLAQQAGCSGVFIGFETPTNDGLAEIGKRYNIVKGADLKNSVARIHRHGMIVVGSYIMGLDCDLPGIGRQIADAAETSGVDLLNAGFLTPLPGTKLWDELEADNRIVANHFPHDWQYYTLGFPVAEYRNLTWPQLRGEMEECWRTFYSPGRITRRLWNATWQRRLPLAILISTMSYRVNYKAETRKAAALDLSRKAVRKPGPMPRPDTLWKVADAPQELAPIVPANHP
jgi:radical SAM superfamily enzyme YgiQ (UPF0313 family)